MIDYEKLKLAHELCEKLAAQEEFVSFTYDFFYCQKEGNRIGINLLLGPDHPEFQEGFYHTENLDPLIARLQELMKTEPKYKVGDKVWVLYKNEIHNVTIYDVVMDQGHQAYYGVQIEDYGVVSYFEKELSSSKQDLIEYQIEYWTKLKTNEISGCAHEHDGGIFGYRPLILRCKNCGEFYK